MAEKTFPGFSRRSGRAGVRNHLLVLGINGLIAAAAGRIAAALPG
jgi:altronate dehydratase large subunit